MFRLTNRVMRMVSIKDQIKQRLAEVINEEGTLRNSPSTKERKYKNVEITQDFKKMDSKRRQEKFENMRKMQLLLNKRLEDQAKLLSTPQIEAIKSQLKQLTQTIQSTEKELEQLSQKIENSDATYMVAQGNLKLAILNQIVYLQYLDKHNPGYVLHPETIAAIENIDYCVNHNLPVNRIKLFEIMPEYFASDLMELEESARKLILEKKIHIDDEESSSSIRYFCNSEISMDSKADLIQYQTTDAFNNMFYHMVDLFAQHGKLLTNVAEGKTPFRNLEHLQTVLLSDMPIKYLPEEEALKKDLIYAMDLKEEWENFRKFQEQEIQKAKFAYIEPPVYIKRNPILMKEYELLMKKFTNPVDFAAIGMFPTGDMTEVELGRKMEEQIRKIVQDKYDPLFIEAMSSDRSKIDKKKLEIEFYNLSTNIMENLLALEDKSSGQIEEFQKLPKQQSLLTSSRRKNKIPLNHLTRMLFLNNKNKDKYNLDFFSCWFGINREQLKTALQGFSYVKLPKSLQKQQEVHVDNVKIQILKFQM